MGICSRLSLLPPLPLLPPPLLKDSLPVDAPLARPPITASTPPGPPLALAPVVRKLALALLLELSGATRRLRLLLPRLLLMLNSSLRLRSLPRKLLTSLPEDAPHARPPITASTPPGPPLALALVVKKLALAPLLVPSGATKMPNLLSSSDQSAISYFLF